jgi:hypothetical protein
MKYILLTIKHKYFVFIAGWMIGGISLWQLIKHDWTKFVLWKAYNNYFFGDKTMENEFAQAWLKHQNLEKHHWEYWMPRSSHNRQDASMSDVSPLPMPEKYVREMIADWFAAGRAYEGKYPTLENWTWLEKNQERIFKNLNKKTIETWNNIILELRIRNFKI